MTELAQFQKAAVARITERLNDPSGSRRYLLADEVGLGKTLVAKGVIEELSKGMKRSLNVIYICSNEEIAKQNRESLVEGAGDLAFSNKRLTLIPLYSRELDKASRELSVRLLSFTPGTSMQIGQSTGIYIERRMLLYLLQYLGHASNSGCWRYFLKGGLKRLDWENDFYWSSLRSDFEGKISHDFIVEFQKHIEAHRIAAPETGKKILLTDVMETWVGEYYGSADDRDVRRKHRLLVGSLRYCLARAALCHVDADLVILDEFQRFKMILENAENTGTIEGNLFSRKRCRVLIISATPYRMYTLAIEEEDHYRDFIKTLVFLYNQSEDSMVIQKVRSGLRRFGDLLSGAHCPGHLVSMNELMDIKSDIELSLRRVMCRTERNWYIDDPRKGVIEVPTPEEAAGIIPTQQEIIEYIRLREFLLKKLPHPSQYAGSVIDFWKSSPSILTFMDSHYALVRALRKANVSVPEHLLPPERKLIQSFNSNLKFRMLLSKIVDGDNDDWTAHRPRGELRPWRFLWHAPMYKYYHDTFFRNQSPRKFLVFSHWRFVPKAIAYIVSHQVEKRGVNLRRYEDKNPLQFRAKTSFYLFDVCYPSMVLAKLVNPVTLASKLGVDKEAREMVKSTEYILTAALKQAGIRVGQGQRRPLWRVVARLEQAHAPVIGTALHRSRVKGRLGREAVHYRKFVNQYLDWMDDTDSPLSVSAKDVNKLARIALFSPAVCVLRSALHLYNEYASELLLKSCLDFCMGALRNYFNREFCQAIIHHEAKGKGGYTSKVLEYSRLAHFQAMMDEYGYLVKNVLQRNEPCRFFDHLAGVCGMYSGSPHLNLRGPKGQMEQRPVPRSAHYSLAFGEQAQKIDENGEQTTSRESDVRDAFNSPFWPFVLATTSKGQEGLNFHLYCRDVVHWNLPSNPVDLEQREGRINRYDSLFIRENIRQDYPLEDVREFRDGSPGNIWEAIFKEISHDSGKRQRFKHGLFPHWVYEPSAVGKKGVGVRRHLFFYSGSRDMARYRDLKNALSLYRLAFGQPRQEDMLDSIKDVLTAEGMELHDKQIESFMINLSPVAPGQAWDNAVREAPEVLKDPEALSALIHDAKEYLQARGDELSAVREEIERLLSVVSGPTLPQAVSHSQMILSVAALIYLVNPYDDYYDFYRYWGLRDDVKLIESMQRNHHPQND